MNKKRSISPHLSDSLLSIPILNNNIYLITRYTIVHGRKNQVVIERPNLGGGRLFIYPFPFSSDRIGGVNQAFPSLYPLASIHPHWSASALQQWTLSNMQVSGTLPPPLFPGFDMVVISLHGFFFFSFFGGPVLAVQKMDEDIGMGGWG